MLKQLGYRESRRRRLALGLVVAAGVFLWPEMSSAQVRTSGPRFRGRIGQQRTAKAGGAAPATTAPAQDPLIDVTPNGTTEATLVQQVRQRLDQEAASLKRQREADGKEPLPEADARSPRAMVDMAHFGVLYRGDASQRFLALHLLVDNPSDQPFVVPRDGITTKVDGEVHRLDDGPAGQNFSFAYGTLHQQLSNYQTPATISVPAQGAAGGWLVYTGLPLTTDVPTLWMSLAAGGRRIEIDVTASQRALLHLDVEALGPRGCLRLLTIQGLLTSINVQSFVEAIEQFTEERVVRAVVRWSPEANLPEQQAMQWLLQSTMQIGMGRPVMDHFPSLPAQVKEFHLVQSPVNGFPNFEQYGEPFSGGRMHATEAAAIGAALKSAYLALPAGELIEEIEHGHPLTRAAALRYGAERLKASHLPFVLARLDDPDEDLRLAAVEALQHFGEPQALDALASLAKQTAQPLSGPAIESLARSRYPSAQARLLELTRQENSDVKRQIMRVLARYPRPQWSDMIYEYVTDPQEDLPIDGIHALLQVGHPRLVDLLERCLRSDDKTHRDFAFPILAERSDARSERLATEYALAELQQRPPDGAIVQFVQRTKLPAAIPMLLKHLETASDKITLLNVLAQIGDDSAGDAIAKRYADFKTAEKITALNALYQLRHAKYRPLAAEALVSSEPGLVQQAAQGLLQDADADACRILIAALDRQTNNASLHHICSALGSLGGAEARAALLKARDSDHRERRNQAIVALMQLRQRSPGYSYIYQAEHAAREAEQAQPAEKESHRQQALEFYDLALQIDPELPEAFAGRASLRQRLGQDEQAARDFEKAYELDPYLSLAIAGVAIVRVQAGKIEEGLKILDQGRERHKNDPVFIYNAACVYSRAYEHLQKATDIPDREARREEFRQKAIAELKSAMGRGLSDMNMILDDPDLAPLKDDPEFKSLIGR